MTKIRLKRAYAEPAPEDGCRILVERLWPRGLSKAKARIDLWIREVAPSTALRKWYGHDPARWQGFRERYREELRAQPVGIAMLRERMAAGPVTFVFASREEKLNSAAALREYLEEAGED